MKASHDGIFSNKYVAQASDKHLSNSLTCWRRVIPSAHETVSHRKSLNFSHKLHEVSMRIHFTPTDSSVSNPWLPAYCGVSCWLQSHFSVLLPPPSIPTSTTILLIMKFAVGQKQIWRLYEHLISSMYVYKTWHVYTQYLFHVLLYFRVGVKWSKAQLWIPSLNLGCLGAPRPASFPSWSPWRFPRGKVIGLPASGNFILALFISLLPVLGDIGKPNTVPSGKEDRASWDSFLCLLLQHEISQTSSFF